MTSALYLQLCVRILGLTVREGMLLQVGRVFDLLELEKRRKGAD